MASTSGVSFKDVLAAGLEDFLVKRPTVACFAMLWTRFCSSPDLYLEFIQCGVSLPSVGEPPNFGPMHFSYQKLAQRFSTVLSQQFASCLVMAVFGNSRYAFLRNCAHRTECFPMVQQYYFGRLYVARLLNWIITKITPGFVSRIGFGIRWEDSTGGNAVPMTEEGESGKMSFFMMFPGQHLRTSGDGNQVTNEDILPPSGSASPHGDGSITTKSAQAAQFLDLVVRKSLVKDYQTQGVWRTVVQTHLIDYTAVFVLDQYRWMMRLARCGSLKRKAMFRMYLVTLCATCIDNAGFLALRIAGAYLGYGLDSGCSKLLGSVNNGFFTFFAENLAQFIGYTQGTVMKRSNKWGMLLYQYLEKKIPLSVDEEDDQARAREEHNEKERDKQQRYQEVHKAAEGEVDYYAALGLKQDATQEEVKKTYRKLALKLHPDKISRLPQDQQEAAALEFKKVNAAHAVLSDESKRREYDSIAQSAGVVPKQYQPGLLMRLAMSGPWPIKAALTVGMLSFSILAMPRVIYYQLFMIYKNFSAPGPGMIERMMRRMGGE